MPFGTAVTLLFSFSAALHREAWTKSDRVLESSPSSTLQFGGEAIRHHFSPSRATYLRGIRDAGVGEKRSEDGGEVIFFN